MRVLEAGQITQLAAALYEKAVRFLPDDVLAALQTAFEGETYPPAKRALGVMLDNARAAGESGLPLCQDTGLCACFVRLGRDVRVEGDMVQAINLGVALATERSYLRASVRHPLTGENTKNNTPVPLDVQWVAGEEFSLTVAPKGAGSENKGRVVMLDPAAGVEGIAEQVVETVRLAGGAPCPPVVVGVGVGGNLEGCALLAKRALLRPIGSANPEPEAAALETELMARINALGIGPQGFGGATTALGVAVETAPCHIASLPVGIALQCHVARHATGSL